MTCSSEFSDPTLAPDFVGRSLQHAITWKNITKSRQIVTLASGKIKEEQKSNAISPKVKNNIRKNKISKIYSFAHC